MGPWDQNEAATSAKQQAHELDGRCVGGERNCRPAADACQKQVGWLTSPALQLRRRKDSIETASPALDILHIDGKYQIRGAIGACSLRQKGRKQRGMRLHASKCEVSTLT